MTEEEAKTKWCPFARVTADDRHVGDNSAWNRIQVDDGDAAPHLTEQTRCIGSACMAFRYVERHAGQPPMNERNCFCGLAGSP